MVLVAYMVCPEILDVNILIERIASSPEKVLVKFLFLAKRHFPCPK